MKELLEAIVANSYVIGGALLSACLGGFIALCVNRKSRLAAAAANFRAAIDPNAFAKWRGHALVNALVQSLPAHRKAVDDFRHYLGLMDRRRLDRAWSEYHGGNAECPDFLVMYGIPAGGPQLLRQRLEKLRDVGKHT